MKIMDPEQKREVPDLPRQIARLKEIREQEAVANTTAIEEQNKWAADNKICLARPVAGSKYSDYDAYMHLSCGSPDDWDQLLINDTIRNQKCIGCGFPLQEAPNGN